MPTEMCYICRNQLDESVKLQIIIQTTTKHTETSILQHIHRLLPSNDLVHVWTDENICENCLNKFDDYDKACHTVKQIEDDLRQLLRNVNIDTVKNVPAKQEPGDDDEMA